jgi:type IV pilus assembly protein PilA
MDRLKRVGAITARDEQGFTLIELLVVIIIIGILAAIAIPVFLNQRQKGYDAQAKSDIRNLAGFEEIYLNDVNSYGTIAQVLAAEPTLKASKDVTLTVVRYNGQTGYCLSAKHVASPKTWYYDSQAGGQQPAGAVGCPVTTAGTVGDSMTG